MKAILFVFLFVPLTATFAQKDFPASWAGEWKGTLEIFNASGKVQELPMELHIQPVDSSENYTWTIIYGEDKVAGRRPYELVPVEPAKGLYKINEKNSIAMEGYLLGGKFFQWFEVSGSVLFTSTALVGEELVWEIVVSSTEPVSSTGNETVDGEEIPEVKTFPVTALQTAKLRR
ncbi:MAG: hypothetical protein EPO28_10875 [Saprospiraceae bacterium]|nr:MAG: hypothetical protein EPO28_10875 [Saprospiraceae bacterium]